MILFRFYFAQLNFGMPSIVPCCNGKGLLQHWKVDSGGTVLVQKKDTCRFPWTSVKHAPIESVA